MQYQSIIRLFNYCNIDCDNNIDFGRLKKILTAEFSIASGGIISIDGFDYTKNEIFRELEQSDFIQRLENHKLVWKNPGLLNCLEKNKVSLSEVRRWMPLKKNEQFVHFVSPYFAVSFDKVMRKLLAPAKFQNAAKWIDLFVFIDNADDEERALRGIRAFIAETIKMLKNANDITYIDIIPQLNCWINQPFHLFLNKLPTTLFKETEDLSYAMYNFIAVVQRANRKSCYKITSQLVKIKTLGPPLTKAIAGLNSILEEALKKERDPLRPWIILTTITLGLVILNLLWIIFPSISDWNRKDPFKSKMVDSQYFSEIRDKYVNIDTNAYYTINHDFHEMSIGNEIYYITLENSKPGDSAFIYIRNNSKNPIAIYVANNDNVPHDFILDTSKVMSLKTNKQTLDFILQIMNDDTKDFVMSNIVGAIHISDSLLRHDKVEIDNSNRDVYLNTIGPAHKSVPIMEINGSEVLSNSSYIIIKGYEYWINSGKKEASNFIMPPPIK